MAHPGVPVGKCLHPDYELGKPPTATQALDAHPELWGVVAERIVRTAPETRGPAARRGLAGGVGATKPRAGGKARK